MNSRLPQLIWIVAGAFLVSVAIAAALWFRADDPGSAPHDETAYVGGQACQSCHQEQAETWTTSHHAKAMQPATAETVLGDFDNAEYIYFGSETIFKADETGFSITTDDTANGTTKTYPVVATFGFDPLQQYIVDAGDGWYQAFPVAWDSRPAEAGGERWYHLYPDEPIKADDPLHWTGRQFNWNQMCATCHATNLEKGFDLAAGTFNTTWTDMTVSCESCHGPGAAHVSYHETPNKEAARYGAAEDLAAHLGRPRAANDHWIFEDGASIASNAAGRNRQAEIGACGACHSRRSALTNSWSPKDRYADHFSPALLDQGLYFPDGQIREEVFVLGSFLQSKMYQAGVTCTDCHDPHSGSLKREGNDLCAGCHLADVYDATDHHDQDTETSAAACVSCHMPDRTYMGVDPRRDHSFPRQAGDANTSGAAAASLANRPRDNGYADLMIALRAGKPGLEGDIRALLADGTVAEIRRATLLNELAYYPGAALIIGDLERILPWAIMRDAPLLAQAYLQAVSGMPGELLAVAAAPFLVHDARVVRNEAVRVLSGGPAALLSTEQKQFYDQASDDLMATFAANSERPESHIARAGVLLARGDNRAAEAAYKTALSLDSGFIPVYVNYADLLRLQNRFGDADSLLQQGLEAIPDSAILFHAYGLNKVRLRDMKAAVKALAAAVRLDPADARFRYVYAVALESTGKPRQALGVIRQGLTRAPQHPDLLYAQYLYQMKIGDAADASRTLARFKDSWPNDPRL